MSDQEARWQEFFRSGFYSKAWRLRIDPQSAQKEVEGLLELLKPSPGSHILDWCGGDGRHSILLAKMGFEVTLLDFAPNHIQTAKETAEKAGVKLNLVLADFRETPDSIQADYAINMFTSGIGYLQEQDDLEALKSLHKALKPGALFLLDTMNLFWLVKNYQPTGGYISEDGTQRVIDQRRFDFSTNRNISQILYWEAGGQETRQQLNHRVYCARDLDRILDQAGFEPLRFYGSFQGNALTFNTKRLIIVSERR